MRLTITILMAFVMCAEAATVRIYFVDPLTNEKDTNAFYITPIGTNVLSNGGVVGRGITTRYVPASNGYRTNTLAVGHYSITNRSLGSGVVIRVPESSSLYDYTNLLISGYNIFVTVTNGESGGTSGALTNHETRIVFFENEMRVGTAGNPTITLDPTPGSAVFDATVEASAFVGSGSGLTSIPDAAVASTITRDSELVAADTVVSNGIVTGLAAGIYAIKYMTTNASGFATNLTRWIDANYREPHWTWNTFASDPNFFLRDYEETAIIRVRRDLSVTNNNAIYIGDPTGVGVYKGLSFWLQGINDGNADSRITFVFTGSQTNSGGVEVARDTSWQFRENRFGADYIDPDTFDHVSIDLLSHDYTNAAYLGWTNRNNIFVGSNLVAQSSMSVTGKFTPAGGIVGDRSISSFSMSTATLYTNGVYRSTFYATVALDPSGSDATAKIVTFKQNNTGTNFWCDISVDDPASEFLVPRYGVSCPLNPSDVFYILVGGGGGPVSITNAKIVSE